MTTATEPLIVPGIDVADMPALDQPDGRECEFFVRATDELCDRPAQWALTFRETCGCCPAERSVLLACGTCYSDVLAETQAAQCMSCLRYVPLLRAEPIR